MLRWSACLFATYLMLTPFQARLIRRSSSTIRAGTGLCNVSRGTNALCRRFRQAGEVIVVSMFVELSRSLACMRTGHEVNSALALEQQQAPTHLQIEQLAARSATLARNPPSLSIVSVRLRESLRTENAEKLQSDGRPNRRRSHWLHLLLLRRYHRQRATDYHQ